MKNTTLLTAAGISAAALLTLGSTFAFKGGFTGQWLQQEWIQQAIEANDYSQLSEELQNKISEDRFNMMVEKYQGHQKLESAIESNDYNAFKESAPDKFLEQIDSQEKFEELVTRHNQMQAQQTAIEDAVKNDDFDAFKAAHEEQLKQRFDDMVSYYKENGSLPRGGKMWFGWPDKMGGEKMWGWFGGHRRWGMMGWWGHDGETNDDQPTTPVN